MITPAGLNHKLKALAEELDLLLNGKPVLDVDLQAARDVRKAYLRAEIVTTTTELQRHLDAGA